MTDGFGGRFLEINIGGIGMAVATPTKESGIQSRTMTRNRAEIDVTSDDDSGWRSIIPEPGVRSVDLSISGVMSEQNYNRFLQRFQDQTNPDNYSVDIFHPPDSAGPGMRIEESGKFFLQSLETTGEHSGAVSFSATFLSSGAITFQNVPNGVESRDVPLFRSGRAVSATSVVLTFDRALDTGSVPAAGSFTIHRDGKADLTPTAVAVVGGSVTLTTVGLVAGDTLSVSYAVPDANPLQSTDEVAAVGIANQPIANGIT